MRSESSRPPGSRIPRRILASLLALAAGLVLTELGLRFLLFSDSQAARRWGASLRDPGLYTSSEADEDHWKLRYLFTPPEQRTSPPVFHPELGWIHGGLRGDLGHRDWDPSDLRRPVLLHGASMAACLTSPGECFQGLLEASDLGQELVLVNHGVGGYGLDQMLMLLERTIDRYRDRDPIVILAPVVGSDLERCTVGFRDWPKPRFGLDGDGLREPEPVPASPEEYLAARPVGIRSYAWRLVRNGLRARSAPPSGRWSGRADQLEHVALVERLLARWQGALEARGLAHGVLFLHGPGAVRPGAALGWQERHLQQVLERQGTAFRNTRDLLRARGRLEEHYDLSGPRRNHLTAQGNEVVFEALLELIEELRSR